jgi:hypothetical protein
VFSYGYDGICFAFLMSGLATRVDFMRPSSELAIIVNVEVEHGQKEKE